jgi:hypothetical protein
MALELKAMKEWPPDMAAFSNDNSEREVFVDVSEPPISPEVLETQIPTSEREVASWVMI